MRYLPAILIVGILNSQILFAQSDTSDEADTLSQYFRFDDASLLSSITSYFPPLFIQAGMDLKAFIASKSFQSIRKRYGDIRAADAIYIRAMQMTNNNTALSLLASTIATFDHRMVGLRIPVFDLYFPLSNESEEEFLRRVSHLPKQLYSDSPRNTYGDRDKLQHFFGSAFLAFVFESRDASERFGEFVEKGEDAFIIDGVLDERDARANRHGQDFGIALLKDFRHTPSEFFKFQIASETNVVEYPNICSGVW